MSEPNRACVRALMTGMRDENVRLCVQTDAAYRLQEGVCVFVRERERERERECMYVRARARGAAAPPRGRSGNTRARFICSCVDCFIEHQF